MKIKKRFLSLLLSGAMVISAMPMVAFAEESSDGSIPIGVSSVHIHHTEHTEDCGYTEGTVGTDCTHEHAEDCYMEMIECIHKHTEDCYPQDEETEEIATSSEAEERQPSKCTHMCSKDSGCITKELDCPHDKGEHDDKCGYTEGTAGTPCNFVCETCTPQEEEQTKTEDKCICTELCIEDSINADCPMCSAKNADLNLCKGKVKLTTLAVAEVTVGDLKLSGDDLIEGTDYSYDNTSHTLTIKSDKEITISGTTTKDHIVVNGGTKQSPVQLTFNNVVIDTHIDNTPNYSAFTLENGYAVIELIGENKLGTRWDGIHETNIVVGNNSSLEFTGTGSLYCNESMGWSKLSIGSGAMVRVTGGMLILRTSYGQTTVVGSGKFIVDGGTAKLRSDEGTLFGKDTDVTLKSGNIDIYNEAYSFGANAFTITGGKLSAQVYSNQFSFNPKSFKLSGGLVLLPNEISADLISDTTGWEGIILAGNIGSIYGNATLKEDLMLKSEQTLTIPSGAKLIVDEGVTITNHGTINNEGTLTNNGTIKNYGTITGNGTSNGNGTIISNSNVTVYLADHEGNALINNTATYGDTIKITATIAEKNGQAKLQSQEAEANTVNFYNWNWGYKNKLNDEAIPVVDGNATIEIELLNSDKVNWTPRQNPYEIIAEFGGTDLLFSNEGSVELSLIKADQSAPSAPTVASKTNKSVTLNEIPNNAHNMTAQYALNTVNTAPSNGWKNTPIFTNLTPNTTYYFFARYDDNLCYNASPASSSTKITTPAFYTVNFDANGGTVSSSTGTTNAEGKLTSLPLPIRSGYRFDGWFTEVNGGTQVTIETVFSNDETIYAHWTQNGSSSIITTPSVSLNKPNLPTDSKTDINGKVDNGGNANVIIPDKTVTNTIKKAQDAAKKAGNTKNGITVTMNIKLSATANSLTATVSSTALDKLIAANVKELKIESSLISFHFDLDSLKTIQKAGNGDMVVKAVKQTTDSLSPEAKKAIDNRPVFDLAIYRNNTKVTEFEGVISVFMPYALSKNEVASKVQVAYVNDSGKVTWLEKSSYDPDKNTMMFATSHFSKFGVGYKLDAPNFTDITNHWAKDSIEFVITRELFNKTNSTTFNPDTAMTRGMFVTALGKLVNADVSSYKQSSFTDVKADAYYIGYVEWAVKNNIMNGIGGGKFAPDQSITREQMAVIMANYAKAIGFELPKVHAKNTFADNAKIATWAKSAVKQMQMAGILAGKTGNKFDPQGTATKAEVSTVLKRFIELAIDSNTAQGWRQNDSGKWMHYENGKAVTGKKKIDGTTYKFNRYGETDDSPKSLTYTTHTVVKNES